MSLGVFLAVALHEVSEQRRHVFAAVAQRRQLQVNDVEAVIQIFAEAAFADEREQIDVGRGDDADIDFDLFGAAQAHKFALLDYAKQLGLRFVTDGGDFVEENRALIGDLEEAFFGGDGAGERAFDVAKELRFEQDRREWSPYSQARTLCRRAWRRNESLWRSVLYRCRFRR